MARFIKAGEEKWGELLSYPQFVWEITFINRAENCWVRVTTVELVSTRLCMYLFFSLNKNGENVKATAAATATPTVWTYFFDTNDFLSILTAILTGHLLAVIERYFYWLSKQD